MDGGADGTVEGTGPTPDDDLGIGYLEDVVPVGRGGFAYVYAATDTRFDRRVAVKVFAQFLTEDDRACSRPSAGPRVLDAAPAPASPPDAGPASAPTRPNAVAC